MRLLSSPLRPIFITLILVLMTGGHSFAQQSADDGSDDEASVDQGTPVASQKTPSSLPSNSGGANSSAQKLWPGHIPLPANSDTDSTQQVTPPSVTLPTPPLPPLTNALAEPTPTPEPEQSATPQPTPEPVFTPPSAATLNLPSAQPAGNPFSAPASVGMPSMRLDDASSSAPGALAGMFDWAKKLRFQAAVRGGYDNNVNSANGTNAIASTFANLNGGVNYRFGSPRLSINVDLTGGVTRYFNPNISQPLQGTMGLGVGVDYRYNPRLVFTFNSSSSYQQQPNITLVGTANNTANNGYYYTANSLAAAYQWSDLLTTVSRFNATASYYPNQANQGFNDPGFTQSFRYLLKPTTTAVVDYNADYYGYGNNGNSSIGQSLLGGFDHIFNPKWFWNFRLGAEFRSSQNTTTGSSTYFGPSMDSNFSWVMSRTSSINWVAHLGTQPSSQQNVSYNVALSSGLNYSQGIFTKLKFNAGIYYLLTNYKDAPVGTTVTINGVAVPVTQLETYNQTNVQANVSLSYTLNRIINLSLGYQYLTTSSPSVASQDYYRSITYLQVSAGL